MVIEQLKYPVGNYTPPKEIDQEKREEWIAILAALPKQLSELVENLSYEGLSWQYRPDGWSIQQVAHHLADSHMNSFIRFKLAMTEETPTIRTYAEDRWAELPDANNPEIGSSLLILEGVHERMVALFSSMIPEDWKRKLYHPEYRKELTLDWMLGMYAWHGEHHLAHIKQAIEREGSFEEQENTADSK